MSETTYQQALLDVRMRVKASGTSFAAGMAVLPKERREAMYALYAFCREVDDIADDGATQELRREGLRQWRERIHSLFKHSQPSGSITLALAHAIKAFSLCEDDFQAIIDGMAMDAGEPMCAPTMDELDLYCDRVASAVGRVSVRIFGDDGPNAMKVAFHLGRALQLTNILRDIAEDAERGRLYLPRELLDKHGIQTRFPKEVLLHEALPNLARELAQTAKTHFKKADAAMAKCKPGTMEPAQVMRLYYGAILDRLIALGWADPTQRVSLPLWQKAWLALSHMLGKIL